MQPAISGNNSVGEAIGGVLADMSWLMDVGYGEHPLPQERNSAIVHVPMPPRLRENLQLLANHRSLPYGASLQRLMLHASVVVGYALARALASGDREMAEVVEQIEWEREMRHAAEAVKRESAYQTYLTMQEKRLSDYIKDRNPRRTQEVCIEVLSFVGRCKDETLRHRLTRLTADSTIFNEAVEYLPHNVERRALEVWLESAL